MRPCGLLCAVTGVVYLCASTSGFFACSCAAAEESRTLVVHYPRGQLARKQNGSAGDDEYRARGNREDGTSKCRVAPRHVQHAHGRGTRWESEHHPRRREECACNRSPTSDCEGKSQSEHRDRDGGKHGAKAAWCSGATIRHEPSDAKQRPWSRKRPHFGTRSVLRRCDEIANRDGGEAASNKETKHEGDVAYSGAHVELGTDDGHQTAAHSCWEARRRERDLVAFVSCRRQVLREVR
mmetsp:Transcript_52715/g.112797  ORF Transcript_52715/g.112797 Transcript_52715/m.112797 type:complete len:238 (-) Transcript_52715:600-1313(-)